MGNSISKHNRLSQNAVHPHVHGELVTPRGTMVVCDGSSPRAWGTLKGKLRKINFDRFIPTCMGNSSPEMYFHTRHSVHPHVHGELKKSGNQETRGIGSSPRAWGTRWDIYYTFWLARFIPTCMGNSPSLVSCMTLETVHPHVHGELLLSINLNYVFRGSSPRAWGTPMDG